MERKIAENIGVSVWERGGKYFVRLWWDNSFTGCDVEAEIKENDIARFTSDDEHVRLKVYREYDDRRDFYALNGIMPSWYKKTDTE